MLLLVHVAQESPYFCIKLQSPLNRGPVPLVFLGNLRSNIWCPMTNILYGLTKSPVKIGKTHNEARHSPRFFDGRGLCRS